MRYRGGFPTHSLRQDGQIAFPARSEQVEELRAAEAGLAQYGPEGAGREVLAMNGHDGLAGWIILMPQELVGSLGPNYFEAGSL